MTCTRETWEQICDGELSPQTAWATGRLSVDGDMRMAQRAALAAGVLNAGRRHPGRRRRAARRLRPIGRRAPRRSDGRTARRASSRSRSTRRARCSSARRSASFARPTAAGPGTRPSGTSGARSRRASRRPRRSSRAGGCWSAATSPTTTSMRPSARPSTAAACSRSRGCRAASSTRSCTRTYWHLYVTLDSARTWYPRPALNLPISTRAIAAARAKGSPDVVYAAAGRAGLWRSVDAWRELVAPARRGQRAVGRDDARALAARRRRAARAPGRTTTARPGTRAAARHDRGVGSRNDRIWYAVARWRAARLHRRRPKLVSARPSGQHHAERLVGRAVEDVLALLRGLEDDRLVRRRDAAVDLVGPRAPWR